MKYNHDRPLSDFQKNIDLLKENGYNPIGVSQIYLEDTFIFKSEKEALNAYKQFEKIEKKISGWWYGKKQFLKEVEKYELENNGYSKVLIHWIK